MRSAPRLAGTRPARAPLVQLSPLALLLAILGLGAPSHAGEPLTTGSIPGAVATGTVTGLAVPRFVSLRPSDTPMREGPGKNHAIRWIYKVEGLPVEVTAEFENWRRIRDADGTEGWVYHSRLAGRRTAMVRTKAKDGLVPLYREPSETQGMSAKLKEGVLASVENCDGTWCRLHGDGFSGYARETELWGVYPREVVR